MKSWFYFEYQYLTIKNEFLFIYHNLSICNCFKKHIPNHYFWRTDHDKFAICSSALYSNNGDW